MNIGLQILKRRRAVPLQLAQEFLSIPVANVSDGMARMTAGGPRLRRMHRGDRMAGPALTVKTRPGDNLMILKALSIAQPGDVIVVDGGGDLTNALIGEIMVLEAIKRGLGGLVIHGSLRDADVIAKSPMPVFASGVTHRGPYKDGPGEINVPIAIDGMVIEPGDLVIGDDDGVLCLPFDAVNHLLQSAREKQAAEARIVSDLQAGKFERPWVDATLARLGCHIEE
ncbi:RraA family protein [Ottowia thiooxydans]|uniref:Putative 4-hydroxy-4-methyl-2-oxoglutarate aldolase n=1 Tax=Ottowia thiooxydans TaxID=219182 RepID=A0ABV2QDV5_9BURK